MSYKPLFIQTISWDWRHDDVPIDQTDPIYDIECGQHHGGRFVIRGFGRMKNGKAVTIIIDDFLPDFNVIVPENWTPTGCQALAEAINKTLGNKRNRSHVGTLRGVNLIARMVAHKFTNRERFKFCSLQFNNHNAMFDARQYLRQYGVYVQGRKMFFDC